MKRTLRAVRSNLVAILNTGLIVSVLNAQQTLRGRVADKNSGANLPGAHVELVTYEKSSISYSTVSDEKGEFTLKAVPIGWYKLKISHVGYKTLKKDSLNVNHHISLATFYLEPDSSQLKPVIIEDQSATVLLEADRKVYRTEAFPNAAGGSVLDVLRNIPGIQVEPSGRIALRGSRGVLLYIDGRQSALTGSGRRALLQALPADQIERIEVITQPGAAYDAEGVSGIINIVMKESARRGLTYGGQLMTGTHNKYNAGAFLFYTGPRLNLSTNYNFRYTALWARGTLDRYLHGDSSERHQKRHWLENGAQHNARLRLRYQPMKTLHFFVEGTFREGHKVESRYFLNTDRNSQGQSSYSDRLNSEAQNDRNAETAAGFQLKPAGDKHLLKGEVSFSERRGREFDRFLTQTLNEKFVVVDPRPEWRLQYLSEIWQIIQGRVDYEWKAHKNLLMESGVKNTLRRLDSDFRVEDLNYDSSRWIVNPALTNRFIYHEWVPAAYVSLRYRLQRWTFKAGLRTEWTQIWVRQVTQNQDFRNSYLRWFPSLSFVLNTGPHSNVRLGYARRINRPSPSWLNPFPDVSDPLTVRYGNPYLNPEISETAELSHEIKIKNFSMASTLYGRHIRSVMGRFVTAASDGTALQTYRNLQTAWSAGVEWAAQLEPAPWFHLLANVNLFYFHVSGQNLQSDLNNSAIGGLIKVIPEVRWKFWTFFVAAQYQLPQATVQTTYRSRYFADASLRADLWKKRISCTLTLTDVLNSFYNYSTTRNAGFTQYNMRKNETQILMLNILLKLHQKGQDDKELRGPEWENTYDD
ncbi:MAG: TonB-dependent receptor [Flavobacteriales bacterium]|nr:TonB-dependent receptor [Flavobacteriales bacterium]MCX7768198.1 TonB-dependent receptor [Flavobacteriales bacterium]MDW8409149.1 TonB-dependent receptor [Flavobacteriales bacterium]